MNIEVMGPSGHLISPYHSEHFPSLEDLFYAHSSQVRFNGHGFLDAVDYSVLHHVVSVAICMYLETRSVEGFLRGLTHEYDELWLGDIPGPTKAVLRLRDPMFFADLQFAVETISSQEIFERFPWIDRKLWDQRRKEVKPFDQAVQSAEFPTQFFVHDESDPGRLPRAQKVRANRLPFPECFRLDQTERITDVVETVLSYGPSPLVLSDVRALLRKLDALETSPQDIIQGFIDRILGN